MLVEGGAVEAAEPVLVGREVARHPVQDQADTGLVAAVGEIGEVVGAALAAGRREEADRLIAPGALERVLADRQELQVGEAHLGHVGDERVGELAPGELAVAVLGHAAPGADMALVDRDRLGARVAHLALGHPGLVAEAVVGEAMDQRGRGGRALGGESHRVGLRQHLAVGTQDLVLVERTPLDLGHEQLPHPALDALAHRVATAVPAVELADHAHPLGVGGPDREGGAGNALHRARVRTQLLVQAEMGALGQEVDVGLAQHRREAVGVLDQPLLARSARRP